MGKGQLLFQVWKQWEDSTKILTNTLHQVLHQRRENRGTNKKQKGKYMMKKKEY